MCFDPYTEQDTDSARDKQPWDFAKEREGTLTISCPLPGVALGALFGSTSFWRKSQVLESEGERRSWRRVADSGTGLIHQFCPTCGSTVYWESEATPELVSVAVGSFADPQFPAPVRTVWTESKHDWLAFPASLPHHSKNPQ